MREPMIVDHAQHAPNACCICTNTQGPFADTFFEDRAGRKYVCKRCAKTFARVFGFAPGKRMDELSDAAGLVEGKDQEIAALLATVEEFRASQRAESLVVRELRSQLEDALGREQTRAHLAETLVATALQLAGVGELEGVAA